MSNDPIEFCTRQLPGRFEDAMEILRERAQQGDEAAVSRLADAMAAQVTLHASFDEDGEVWLVLRDGTLEALGDRPAGPAVRHAFSVPSAMIRRGLDLLTDEHFEDHGAAHRVSALASAKAAELFGQYPCAFDVEVTDIPEFGTLNGRAALGHEAMPEQPDFALSIAFDELVEARAQQMPPQQLFMAGKLRITGDTAKAMMLGMTLMQLR